MMRRVAVLRLAIPLVALLMLDRSTWAEEPFAIEVVDAATGRGVPLIELKTVNEIRYVTDSAGLIAFDEPGLIGQAVFFTVRGHGYEFPKDGFGYRGVKLDVAEGGRLGSRSSGSTSPSGCTVRRARGSTATA